MDPLALAERRLQWLDRRQTVLSQNVANADTPGFQPRDLMPFAQALAGAETLARTSPLHVGTAGSGSDGRAQLDRRALQERTPDGNAVSLDTQAVKIAETDQAHALAINLHRRWTAMMRTALGRGA